ncbi:hypothetical protein QE152_g21719 [Popillia japonica]|uniref:Uncharacterized protein n=1 Tax=Popillia japonica TaxID=7064 RepID=A0AAW1KN89_POPJA
MSDFNFSQFIFDNSNDFKTDIIKSLLEMCNLKQRNTITNASGRLLDLVLSDVRCEVEMCNLKQRNTITNASGRLLDLVLSDVRCEVNEDVSAIVNIDAHHPALLIDITAKSVSIDNFPHKNVKQYNIRKYDFLSLYNSLLEVDWGVLDGISDVNTYWKWTGECWMVYRTLTPSAILSTL